jgi:hypothetical protein
MSSACKSPVTADGARIVPEPAKTAAGCKYAANAASQTAHIADVLPAVGTILNTAAGEIAPSAARPDWARRLEARAAPPAFAEKSGHDFAMRPTNTTGLQYPATRIVCAGFSET